MCSNNRTRTVERSRQTARQASSHEIRDGAANLSVRMMRRAGERKFVYALLISAELTRGR